MKKQCLKKSVIQILAITFSLLLSEMAADSVCLAQSGFEALNAAQTLPSATSVSTSELPVPQCVRSIGSGTNCQLVDSAADPSGTTGVSGYICLNSYSSNSCKLATLGQRSRMDACKKGETDSDCEVRVLTLCEDSVDEDTDLGCEPVNGECEAHITVVDQSKGEREAGRFKEVAVAGRCVLQKWSAEADTCKVTDGVALCSCHMKCTYDCLRAKENKKK